MITLVVVIWVLYLSECFVRWRPGDWVFREGISGGVRTASAPDFTLWNERFAFVWTTIAPWGAVHVCSGDEIDRAALRARLARLRRESRWVRRSAGTLFALLLVVVPALVAAGRLLPAIYWVAAVGGAAWAATFVTFVLAHRRVFGGAPEPETWLVLLLSPVDLIRAPAVLSLRAIEGSHPVAAADALCDDAEFLRVARLWHFDAPGLRPAIESLATARDLGETLTAAPADVEPGVSLFCRRCYSTFKSAASRCPDCDSVELTRLDALTCRR